jgi:hypothetical protein
MYVCGKCAKTYGDTSKGGIGMWKGECVICGDTESWCAESEYDFGISDDDIESIRKFQSMMRESNKGKWGMV